MRAIVTAIIITRCVNALCRYNLALKKTVEIVYDLQPSPAVCEFGPIIVRLLIIVRRNYGIAPYRVAKNSPPQSVVVTLTIDQVTKRIRDVCRIRRSENFIGQNTVADVIKKLETEI